MAKNYGDTVWDLNRPGLVIEDVKQRIFEAKFSVSGSIWNSFESEDRESLRVGLMELMETLGIVSELLDTIPPDNGPNIQTAATKALDQPIDVDVFANDLSEV